MKKIKLYPSGKEIMCDDGQTVLSALEKNGYAIPNNCRAGACGECKIKVRSGDFDQGFILDFALPKSDRDLGFGLMCMARIKSEVLEIEWATENALPKLFAPIERMPYLVIEKNLVTSKIVKLKLRALGNPLKFWPGQYVTIGDEEHGIASKCYSIANIPNQEGDLIFFITKIKEGKTSLWIHDDLFEGETIMISGPYGTFIGDPSTEKDVLCLAAGSGLAPICSLANAALLRGSFKNPATVIFSARTKKDIFSLGSFKYLESKFNNFKFKIALTGGESSSGGSTNGSRGYLKGRIPTLLKDLYPDLSNYSIFIAGSPEFVEDCKQKVLELGGSKEQIHLEGFVAQ